MTLSRTEQAARNNAIWCDTVCRAHDAPGEFHDSLWLNRHPTPRFYPNVVTLSGDRGSATQLAHIQALTSAGLHGSWSVKDSFCTLDLAALAFEPLFEAMWIRRAPSRPLSNTPIAGIRWARVRDAIELAKWESAWSERQPNDRSTIQPRVFLPSLLVDEDVVFLAAYRKEEIVAGAVANRTEDVVGLSNVFVPAEDTVSFWASCIATVQESFPGLPLVGYESGEELAVAQAAGFEMLQPLKVWLHRREVV